MKIKRSRFTLILLALLFSSKSVVAQRLYADQAIGSASGVTGASNAAIPNDDSSAKLFWHFLTTKIVHLQLLFPEQIKEGTATFIRADNFDLDKLQFTTDTNEQLTPEQFNFPQTSTETFIKVTPLQPYRVIKVTLRQTGFLNTADIYYAFNGNDPEDCGTVFATKPILPTIEPINLN